MIGGKEQSIEERSSRSNLSALNFISDLPRCLSCALVDHRFGTTTHDKNEERMNANMRVKKE